MIDLSRFPELARFYAAEVFGRVEQMLADITGRGIAAGAFRAVPSHVAARLILSALVQQAFWCNHVDVFGPSVAGGCHRVVADTCPWCLEG